MLLYANGDSHTSSWSYIDIIGENLGIEFVNQAIDGHSNTSIIRRTREYLKHTTPNLIIIGWSSWEREEWQYKGKYYKINSGGPHDFPNALKSRYKEYVSSQTQETLIDKSKYWHTKIFEFHQELGAIPHVFFNCMYNFFNTTYEYPWGKCFIGPYDNDQSYYHWLKAQGCEADEWYHYKADGHRLWANRLMHYIKDNHIL